MSLTAWSPRILSILRIMAGLLFLEHGMIKLFHFPGAAGMPDTTLSMVAGIIELVGGFLLTLGLLTRAAAFICSGEMAVAYFMIHMQKGFFPALNGGDGAILFCFVFLYLVFAGAGPWSIDALLRRDL